MNTLALLPNLMGPDGLVIFLFILLFFGAKRLPELAKGLGSAVREFSKAKDEIEHEITRAPTPQIQPPRDTQPYVSPAVESNPANIASVPPAPVVIPAPVSHVTEESHGIPNHPVV